MKKKIVVKMMIAILFLLTLIISSTYAYFNIVNTSSNNTTSNYNAQLEDIEKYGTSLLTGGEGELHLRVKASDMTPSKIGNKYYATTSDDDYQLRRGNHIVSKATIQKGLNNYEYNCTSKLTITLYGTMVSEDGLQVGDAKLYLRGTNNNIKNEEYDLKTLIDELDTNSDGKKIYAREIEYLLTSNNEGKVMIDVEFANNNNNQTTSSGKNLNIEITNSELVCGLGNSKVYANLYGNSSTKYAYRSTEWRNKIITASFVKSKPSEEELTTKPIYWDLTDMSKSEEGSVIGWLEEREETDTYDLYIGSNKEIYTTSLSSAFYSMTNLQEIKFDNLNTSEATSMSYTFAGLNGITSMEQIKGFKELDTSNVTNMSWMFNSSKITKLDLSSFDTSKVTDMSDMFHSCKIIDLNLSNFDTSNVTNMYGMFSWSDDLTNLDLSNFNTSKVTDMGSMFFENRNLISLNLSHFDTSKVTNMAEMFNMNGSGGKLENLNLSSFNTKNVTNMSSMFSQNYNLASLDLSSFDTSKVTNMHFMFFGLGVKSLEDIKGLYKFDTSKVTNIGGIFANCKNLTEIDLTKFELDSVTNMSYMFAYLDGITSTEKIKGFKELDTSKITNMSHMFYNSKITDLDLSHFDTTNVTDMSNMFSNCSNLVNLNLKSFNTKNVTNMSHMFSMNNSASKLTSLDLSHFNTSSVTNISDMFYNYQGTTLDLSNFDTFSVTNMSYMFVGCRNLKDLKLNKATFDKVTSYSNMFSSSIDDIHLTIKKGQETFINDRLNDAKITNYTIDLVD